MKWLRRNPNLAFSDTVQDCNERTVQTLLKGGGDGVRLFPISSNITTADSHAGSFSAACGITIWQGESLGLSIRDCALSCDPTANLIHADKLGIPGATFAAKPLYEGREFLASRDDWFRPVALAGGPDGALYVADMYRKVIEHPDYLPEEIRKHTDFETGKAMGRIWKVVRREGGIKPEGGLAEADTAKLIAKMGSSVAWTKATSARLLFERRTPSTVPQLFAALGERGTSSTQYRRVRMLDALGAIDDARLAELITAKDVGVSLAAFEICRGQVPAGSLARAALLQQDARSNGVWFAEIIALGDVDVPAALPRMPSGRAMIRADGCARRCSPASLGVSWSF